MLKNVYSNILFFVFGCFKLLAKYFLFALCTAVPNVVQGVKIRPMQPIHVLVHLGHVVKTTKKDLHLTFRPACVSQYSDFVLHIKMNLSDLFYVGAP